MCWCSRKNAFIQRMVIEPAQIIPIDHKNILLPITLEPELIKPYILTPELTPDEIVKIKGNLDTIISLNEAMYIQQGNIINEVWLTLQGQMEIGKNASDPKKNDWLNYFVDAVEIIGVVTEQPEIDIAAIILGGVVEYITTDSSTQSKTNVNLDSDFGSLSSRNTNTYEAAQVIYGMYHDDPNTYRDQPLSIPGKDPCTLRDLINIVIPEKDSETYQLCVQAQSRQFRTNITIPEMIKMKNWDIYYIEDDNTLPDFGFAFKPTDGNLNDFQRSRNFNSNNVGNQVRIVANDEVRRYHPDYPQANGFGTDNNDLKTSYLNANNSFITQFQASLIYPWTVTNISVYSCRWYIMERPSQVNDRSSNYSIANGDFMKWLFIDDGFGNITNPDGVLYRIDLLTSGILANGVWIPAQNGYPIIENIVFKSSDQEYKYPGKSTNSKVKIYVNKNKNIKI
jgi:hypothetical protein